MSEYLSAYDGQIHNPVGVYPLNWDSGLQPSTKANIPNISNHEEENIYPDFKVWRQTEEEDKIMKTHLQKGYMEPHFVKHEDQSGRQLITELLTRSNTQSQLTPHERDNKLHLMGQIFVDAMHKRRIFNGIKSKGVYKPPPRVTLTEHKKDAWLKKLANSQIPLQELSRAIPHGLRNKVLLEQCLNHQVPIPRAIWLIKCISTNEQRQLKRKTTNVSTMTLNANKWIVEWTEQITSFFESIIEGCFNFSLPKEVWRFRLNYTIELVVNLYSDELMNQITFLTWITRYASQIVNNAHTFADLKPIAVHQMIIKLFWFKIIRYDYLTKELSETILLTLAKTNQLPRPNKFDSLAMKITGIFQYLAKYLFYYNSDIFILPSNWNYLKPYLRKVLDMHLPPVSDQFKLIAYRNESLTIDELDRSLPTDSVTGSSVHLIPNDKFSLILYKLNISEKESLSSLSKIIFEDSSPLDSSNWKDYIPLIFQWCIQSVGERDISLHRINMVLSILQFRQSQLLQSKSKKLKQFKSDLENRIIDFVYMMSEILNYHNEENSKGTIYDINNFLILIGRLYSMKLFVVSSYLRRLIASGVIYLSVPDRTCYIHILILNLFSSLNDSNLKSILRRLMDSTSISIKNEELTPFKDSILKFIDTIFSGNSEPEGDIIQYQCKETLPLGDPTQVSKYVQLSEFFYQQIDAKLKASHQKLYLNRNKLLVLCEMFQIYPVGLPRFLVLIIDKLNQEPESFQIDSNETLVYLIKMLFINIRLMRFSIFSLKQSLWDHCLNILSTWIDSDRYEIVRILHNAKLPKTLLSYFGAKVSKIDSIKNDEVFLTVEELLALDLASYERLSNAAEFSHYTTLAITRYSNAIRGREESINISLIIKFLKSLQSWKPEEFTKCLCDYLLRYLKPTLQLDYESNSKVLLRLVIDEFISIKRIVEIFHNRSTSYVFFESDFDDVRILWDVFFNTRLNFDFSERFLYEFAKFAYISDNLRNYYKILSEIIYTAFEKTNSDEPMRDGVVNVATNVDVEGVNVEVGVNVGVDVNPAVGVDVMDTFHHLDDVSKINSNQQRKVFQKNIMNGKLLATFWELISSHTDLCLEYYYLPSKQYSMVDVNSLRNFMFSRLMNFHKNEEFDSISVIENLNYFNLPILRWSFTYLLWQKYQEAAETSSTTQFVILIECILGIAGKADLNCKLVGELFSFLPDDFKSHLLSACEEIYLNSESFPTVLIQGINVAQYLNCIISSCSRLQTVGNNNNKYLEMSDALVFSLNSALEKLISICHNIDHHQKKRVANHNSVSKELELGVKMVSKIILLHKYFLVELILKRSVNLQRDVLIMNSMKLFNHKIMLKNPKLKNLLYDVLISLKIIISESITQQFQRNETAAVATANNNSPSVWINKGATPTNASFFSPMNSPKPNSTAGINVVHTVTAATSPLTNSNSNDVNVNTVDITGEESSGQHDLGETRGGLGGTGINAATRHDSHMDRSALNQTEGQDKLNPPGGLQGYGILSSKTKLNSASKPAGQTSRGGVTNFGNKITNGNAAIMPAISTNTASNTNNGHISSNAGTTSYIIMPNILNIKPPSFNNNLKSLLSMFDLKDTIPENQARLYTVDQNWDGTVNGEYNIAKYNTKPFELIEDSCPRYAMDDCAIGLQMFGLSARKENPP